MRRRSRPVMGMKTLGVVALSAGLLTAACGSSSKSSGTGKPGGTTSSPASQTGLKTGGTLKLLIQGDLSNLDTSQEYETAGWTVYRAITRQLTSYAGDATGLAGPGNVNPVDDLAASHTISPDGLTYTFTLRPDIHFAGPTSRAIKAADFTYALKRLCDPNGQAGGLTYYTGTIKGMQGFCDGFAKVKTGDPAAVKTYIDGNQISGISTPDDTHITFTLSQKAGDFLNILALPFATPVPEEILSPYLTDSAQMKQHFVSSGPYYLKTYVPAKNMDIERTPGYDAASDPLRKSYVDSINVDETVGSDESEIQQIQAGTADYSLDITLPPAATVSTLRSENSPTLHTSPSGTTNYIVFNTKTGKFAPTSTCGQAFQKVAVRQAFNYAVNKQDIVQVFGGPVIASATNQILTSTITGYQKIDPYPTPNNAGDPAKAKAMLAAAGYPNGLTCRFLYRDKNKGPATFTTLQQDMAKAGITLRGEEVPNADYYGKHLSSPATNDWDLAAPKWSPDWQGNGARSFFLPLLSDTTPCAQGTTNYGCFDSAPFDAQITAALGSQSPGPLWAAVDKAVSAQAPWAPMAETNAVVIESPRVKGFKWFNFADNGDIANLSVS